jgi:hypothetical protein
MRPSEHRERAAASKFMQADLTFTREDGSRVTVTALLPEDLDLEVRQSFSQTSVYVTFTSNHVERKDVP